MQNTIKIAIASAILLLLGSQLLFLGGGAFTRGFFYVSKYQITIIHQEQSPLFFYAYVTFMLFFGGLLLVAGLAVWFSREIRKEAIDFVDSAILSRPSSRWSVIVLAIVLVAVLVAITLLVL